MIIKFLKRSVIEVLEAVSALASVFAYMLAANFISELLRLSDGGFMFLATALTGPAINTCPLRIVLTDGKNGRAFLVSGERRLQATRER